MAVPHLGNGLCERFRDVNTPQSKLLSVRNAEAVWQPWLWT